MSDGYFNVMSTGSYQPPFTFTNEIVGLVSRISEALGAWSARSATTLTPLLRRGNRIQTIQASLAIEHNTLSVEQVSAVIDGKPVMGPPREIQEVRNAFAAYEKLEQWQPTNEQHLLEAHRLLMMALVDDLGRYRLGGVGVYHDNKLIHMAPPANQVSRLMGGLFQWLRNTDLPPLVASCLFHYEFEFIHPFSDGNGRMGRLWQTLILARWRPELVWLPVESVVRDRQQAYYDALGQADNAADATPFVTFMLEALEQALEQALERALAENDGVSDEVNDGVNIKLDSLDLQLLAHIRQQPHITQDELVALTGKSASTIQRHIRKLRQYHIERVGSDKTGYWRVVE